jgi:hypothetical protein
MVTNNAISAREIKRIRHVVCGIKRIDHILRGGSRRRGEVELRWTSIPTP